MFYILRLNSHLIVLLTTELDEPGPLALTGFLVEPAVSRAKLGGGRNGGMTGFKVSFDMLELGGFIS